MFLLMTSTIWKAISNMLQDIGSVCKQVLVCLQMMGSDCQRIFENATTYLSLGTFGTCTEMN